MQKSALLPQTYVLQVNKTIKVGAFCCNNFFENFLPFQLLLLNLVRHCGIQELQNFLFEKKKCLWKNSFLEKFQGEKLYWLTASQLVKKRFWCIFVSYKNPLSIQTKTTVYRVRVELTTLLSFHLLVFVTLTKKTLWLQNKFNLLLLL